jgi:hypothetical protein
MASPKEEEEEAEEEHNVVVPTMTEEEQSWVEACSVVGGSPADGQRLCEQCVSNCSTAAPNK